MIHKTAEFVDNLREIIGGSKMREYRAWDKGNKKWIDNFMVSPFGQVLTLNEDGDVMTNEIDAELVKNTGLKDIDGNSIFEGDILSDYIMYDGKALIQRIYVVEWDEEYALFGTRRGNFLDRLGQVFQDANGDLEIIGNIYENKELLE